MKFQLVQERLTEMLSDLTGLQLYCKQLATLDAAGELTQAQASLGKYMRLVPHAVSPQLRATCSAETASCSNTM